MSDFLRKGEIIIHPDLQNREQNPVTMFAAQLFLDNFQSDTFDLDSVLGHIVIDDGDIYKDYLSGCLYRETIEEVQQSRREPTCVGRIRFEASGQDKNLTFRILAEPVRCPWNQLPAWWHDYPKGDVHRLIAAVDTNLQRREPLGQSDTIGFVRQLAITGDPCAIPVLRKAVRHQRLSLRIEASLALHALGDPGGVTALIHDYQHCPIDETDFHILKALECIHNPRAEAIVSERRAAEAKREKEKQDRIREGRCVDCGRGLSVLDKLAGRQAHKRCS